MLRSKVCLQCGLLVPHPCFLLNCVVSCPVLSLLFSLSFLDAKKGKDVAVKIGYIQFVNNCYIPSGKGHRLNPNE